MQWQGCKAIVCSRREGRLQTTGDWSRRTHLWVWSPKTCCRVCQDKTMPNIIMPAEPDLTTATVIKIEIWKNQCHQADEKRATLEDNWRWAYVLVYNPCSPVLQTNLKRQDCFSNVEMNQDVVGFMELVRGICSKYNVSSEPVMLLVQEKDRVYTCYQGHKQPNNEYAEELEAYADIFEEYDGEFGNKPRYLYDILRANIWARDPCNPTTNKMDAARSILKTTWWQHCSSQGPTTSDTDCWKWS